MGGKRVKQGKIREQKWCQPPETPSTGTPTAHAKNAISGNQIIIDGFNTYTTKNTYEKNLGTIKEGGGDGEKA